MKYNFNPGDRVQFKSWEELQNEFTEVDNYTTAQGHPLNRIMLSDGSYFTNDMKHLCGTYAILDAIGVSGEVYLKHFSTDGETYWTYKLDMLKPVENNITYNFKIGDRVQFKSWAELEMEFGTAKQSQDNINYRVIELPNHFYFGSSMKYLCGSYATISYIDGIGQIKIKESTTDISDSLLSAAMVKPAKNEPTWSFTKDETTILNNLENKWNYIVRDEEGDNLYLFTLKPRLSFLGSYYSDGESYNLSIYNHLFRSIKINDENACKFRLYINKEKDNDSDKITLEEFWNSKEHIGITCRTREQIIELCEAFNKMGKKWASGDNYLSSLKDEIPVNCYLMNDGGWCSFLTCYYKDCKFYEFEDIILN